MAGAPTHARMLAGLPQSGSIWRHWHRDGARRNFLRFHLCDGTWYVVYRLPRKLTRAHLGALKTWKPHGGPGGGSTDGRWLRAHSEIVYEDAGEGHWDIHPGSENEYGAPVIARPVDENDDDECRRLAAHCKAQTDWCSWMAVEECLASNSLVPYGLTPRMQRFFEPDLHHHNGDGPVNPNAVVVGSMVLYARPGLPVYTVRERNRAYREALDKSLLGADRDACRLAEAFLIGPE